MKKLIAILTALFCLVCCAAFAETAQVTTVDAFFDALENESVDLIEITADMTLTQPVVLTKEVVLKADLVFQPAPDEEFMVKSIEIPEDIAFSV